ncbi:hypothetical protein HQQ94_07435 [Shewanella sp. VB17]|uniref:hypothetical protein n=1 Tax=Shewanella sp. VB17 TaxID=2739432 RepID=UPI0015671F2C|nr:hypothetical protein [Shewanella sp. VB17]NRD73075.1 hypothetical protein [Shewanella sp. VB17]
MSDKESKGVMNIGDIDWEEGTPGKLKNVSIAEIEAKLSLVIDELIGKGADTVANIDTIDFSGGVNSSVKLNITFSKKMGSLF